MALLVREALDLQSSLVLRRVPSVVAQDGTVVGASALVGEAQVDGNASNRENQG